MLYRFLCERKQPNKPNAQRQKHTHTHTHAHTARFQFTHSYLCFTFIPAFKNSYFSATSDSIKLLFRHCFKTFARCEATGLDGKKLSSTRIRRIDQENASLQMHDFRSSQNPPVPKTLPPPSKHAPLRELQVLCCVYLVERDREVVGQLTYY